MWLIINDTYNQRQRAQSYHIETGRMRAHIHNNSIQAIQPQSAISRGESTIKRLTEKTTNKIIVNSDCEKWLKPNEETWRWLAPHSWNRNRRCNSYSKRSIFSGQKRCASFSKMVSTIFIVTIFLFVYHLIETGLKHSDQTNISLFNLRCIRRWWFCCATRHHVLDRPIRSALSVSGRIGQQHRFGWLVVFCAQKACEGFVTTHAQVWNRCGCLSQGLAQIAHRRSRRGLGGNGLSESDNTSV